MVIESKRLKLVRPVAADLEFCCRLYETPEMMAHLGVPTLPREFNEQRFWKWMKNWDETGKGPYVAREKSDDRAVAIVVIFDSKYNDEDIQEMGWMVGETEHGKGYGTEAADALLNHAIQHWGAKTIMCFPGKTNIGSNKIPEKLGFKYLGERDYPWLDRILKSSVWRYEA